MALVLNFDGACEPVNPGGTASGAWIIWRDGVEVGRGVRVFYRGGEQATNNAAEWCALGFALRDVRDTIQPDENLEIRGDSQLVIKQLTKQWQAKHPRMIAFRDRCLELLDGIAWKATWIPREQNAEVDRMSRGAK